MLTNFQEHFDLFKFLLCLLLSPTWHSCFVLTLIATKSLRDILLYPSLRTVWKLSQQFSFKNVNTLWSMFTIFWMLRLYCLYLPLQKGNQILIWCKLLNLKKFAHLNCDLGCRKVDDDPSTELHSDVGHLPRMKGLVWLILYSFFFVGLGKTCRPHHYRSPEDNLAVSHRDLAWLKRCFRCRRCNWPYK